MSMIALGRLALIAADRGDWRGCGAKVEAAFDVVRTNGLEEYWICSSAHIARGRLFRHDRRPTEAGGELERAVSLARRGAGLVEWSYALTTLAELRASWAIAAPHASWCSKRVSCSRALLSPARSHCDWLGGWKARCDL